MVDTIATTVDGVPSTHVYFQLNYPPEIRKFQKKPGDSDEKLYSEGNRWRYVLFVVPMFIPFSASHKRLYKNVVRIVSKILWDW